VPTVGILGSLLLCSALLYIHYFGTAGRASVRQGSHASWKVLDFFLDFPGPGKSWKISLVLKSPGAESLRPWKVLENEDSRKLTNLLWVKNKQRVALA